MGRKPVWFPPFRRLVCDANLNLVLYTKLEICTVFFEKIKKCVEKECVTVGSVKNLR